MGIISDQNRRDLVKIAFFRVGENTTDSSQVRFSQVNKHLLMKN